MRGSCVIAKPGRTNWRRFSITSAASVAVVIAAFGPGATPAAVAENATPKQISRPLYVTQAPIVMLKDVNSGAILFSRGADKSFAPASMAKVMTAYVVLDLIDRGDLARDKKFTVSAATWKKWNYQTGGSTMFLRAGDKVSVDDLMKGLITVSANDAAAVLAIGIDGSEEAFARRMNVMAAKLGMRSSRFGNPVGWPDGGATKVSAADLILLAERLIHDFPRGYARYFAIPEIRVGTGTGGKPILHPNTNPLLGHMVGVDGLKTGHTNEAGYCFLSSATRGGRRLIMVVAGLPTRNERRDEAQRLMNWGFDQWERREIAPGGTKLGRVEVGKGSAPTVAATASTALQVTVPKGFQGGFKAVMRTRAPVTAPVARGTPVADLIVTPDGMPPQTTVLVAANDVKNGGIWARARTGLYRLTGL